MPLFHDDYGNTLDPYKARSQIGYTTCGNTVISWWSIKHTMTTNLDHLEIFAIDETSWECIWLRYIIQYTRESCELSSIKDNLTILYKDIVVCIVWIKEEYIKGDGTRYMSLKFVYTYKLWKSGEIVVQWVRSSDN